MASVEKPRNAAPKGADPHISIVIPIYNEQAILHAAVVDLRERLEPLGWSYEIILAENGSKDRTIEIGHELAAKYADPGDGQVKIISHGRAELRQGPEAGHPARPGRHRDLRRDRPVRHRLPQAGRRDPRDRAPPTWSSAASSPRAPADERPLIRHAASVAYSALLKIMLGFRGTDTHGLKAFRRAALLDTVRACLVEKDVFASEFVIRADRGGVLIREIPVAIIEKRPPSINLFKRVPNVMKSLGKLTWAIRVRG